MDSLPSNIWGLIILLGTLLVTGIVFFLLWRSSQYGLEKAREELLNLSIERASIKMRVRIALRKNGIETVRELTQLSEDEAQDMLEAELFKNTRIFLEKFGLSFRESSK